MGFYCILTTPCFSVDCPHTKTSKTGKLPLAGSFFQVASCFQHVSAFVHSPLPSDTTWFWYYVQSWSLFSEEESICHKLLGHIWNRAFLFYFISLFHSNPPILSFPFPHSHPFRTIFPHSIPVLIQHIYLDICVTSKGI